MTKLPTIVCHEARQHAYIRDPRNGNDEPKLLEGPDKLASRSNLRNVSSRITLKYVSPVLFSSPTRGAEKGTVNKDEH